jgi:hypothetical protein
VAILPALSTWGYTLPADFVDLLDDAGDLLVVPRIAPTPVVRSAMAYDDLGPHAGKWNFDMVCLLRSSIPVADAVQSLDITRWRGADRFIGEPQVRGWLVDGVFPA